MTNSKVKGSQMLNYMIRSYLFLLNISVSVNISSPKICLPKGVTRGCSNCSGCQKVSARWNPAGALSYALEDAIVFHPNEEDFKDTFKYIKSIRQQVEPYGMCRIVPPSSWKLPSFFEEDDIWQDYKFSTQVQRVNGFQNHGSCSKVPSDSDTREAKRRKLDTEFSDACAENFSSDECQGSENFYNELGPEFSLIAFKRYADDFHQCYFSREVEVPNVKVSATKCQALWEPSEQNIEGEYWRIVEKPTDEIEVLYGTDTICEKLGREYSVPSNQGQASDSVEGFALNWDLNHLNKLPGSLLSFETLDSSGILAPRLHIGMCFSYLPWTVQENHLYKLQYLHLGAPRIWYSTPGCDSHKFEAVAKRHFPDSGKEHLDPLHAPNRQLTPATLKSEGIPVHRCIQRPGEFVLFLPGAYHTGFDCGFSCSASAVFAPLDWLPLGQISIELYRDRRRKTLISYDKVLLRAADEALKAQWEFLLRGKKTSKVLTWKEALGKDGVLAKTLRARIRSETRCRDYLSSPSQSRKMDKAFVGDGRKLECSICCHDLYLSAVSCHCTHNKYSCLIHAKHFCSCPWSDKLFHFRYDISELNILGEAVEGKLSAMRIWVKENLGLALQWDKPKPNQCPNGPFVNPSSTAAVKDKVVYEKDSGFDSKLHSEAKKTLFQMNSDDLKGTKAGKSGLKDLCDDTSSSSSSDFDIEEYVTHLEETWSFPSNRKGESMANSKERG
ncbi:putative lysine-specific demethylase JMJ16 isoform X2 [Spinacia oleracea]|uniref:Lysine-specific demethylase JMJ16 isoform X2 n=1 Tax=Spinacia oleracea TaxID=3562 RepID=A0ABM3QLV1_SPIOL|nr:putative lysine-specific demethylase JMJ16 isoform X2 [Spinacia oleracea]